MIGAGLGAAVLSLSAETAPTIGLMRGPASTVPDPGTDAGAHQALEERVGREPSKRFRVLAWLKDRAWKVVGTLSTGIASTFADRLIQAMWRRRKKKRKRKRRPES